MTDRLPFVVIVAVAAGIIAADLITDGQPNPRWIGAAVTWLVLATLVLIVAKSGASRTRHEKRWQHEGQGPWAKHRTEGDPR